MTDTSYTFRPIDRSRHEILVVDDDPVSRYATARLLRSAGFMVREASTGAEGFANADERVSVVVLDVHLPDIDGFELSRRLRARASSARLPVLHLSAAYVRDEDKVRGLDSGGDAYLTHPVEPSVLIATIQALVRTRVAEEAMRRSEEKFRAIYARVPNGIGLVDAGGVLVDANPALAAFLGGERDRVIGRVLSDFLRDDQRADAQTFFCGDGTASQWREFSIVRDSQDAAPFEWTVSADVEPGINMVIANDLSQLVALEADRQRVLERERDARNSAENLSRMKDEFIAVLSHELRAPLNVIVGWTHVLMRHRPTDEAMTERALAAIDRNTRLQATLISDLLDMSRMNMGKTRLNIENVEVMDLVRMAASNLGSAADAKGRDVEVRAIGPIPAIRADPARLHQILANLLGNARKFSALDAPIRVEVFERDGGVCIRVIDFGQGIDPAFLPFLFDRFSQADAGSNRQRGGLGLGLSIVRHLAEAHGGTVTAASAGVGTGATFEVWLPVSRQPDDASGETNASGGLSLQGRRLLVVDDDPEVCALLQVILGDRGADVVTANDVDAALEAIAAAAFDLLISDIGMPGRDGYQLIAEVRRRETGSVRLPAIALTAFARQQGHEHAITAGFDAHCAKPLRPHDLVSQIERLLTIGDAERP